MSEKGDQKYEDLDMCTLFDEIAKENEVNGEANLRKGENVTDTINWPFQVLADSLIEAEGILREYLLHPEQTGIRYIEWSVWELFQLKAGPYLRTVFQEIFHSM